MLGVFWAWCWEQLNSHLAARLFNNPQREDAPTTLLNEFDYIWELRDSPRLRGIAFLCFLHFRRAEELGSTEPGPEQLRFEHRILRLCEDVITESASDISPQVLQVMAMNWCATVLMSWQYLPEASRDFSAEYARLGLKGLIEDALGVDRGQAR